MPASATQPGSSRLPGLALLLAMAALPALPQTAPQASIHPSSPTNGLYRIAGRVVNAATGEPVRHATVAVLAEEDSHTIASAESDSEGRFALERLPAAKYQLTASKRGFRTAFYDEHDEFSTAIVTGPGQETSSLIFRLTPGAVLYGVVTTDGGDPVEGAKAMLFLKSHDGKPGSRIAQSDSTVTDDTGAYEFDDLAAGEYLLAVAAEPWYALHSSSSRSRHKPAGAADSDNAANEPTAALDVVYPVTFYDSTPEEAAATRIVLAGGSREEANINLHPVPALHIAVDTPRKQDGSIARAELRQTVFGAVVSAETAGFLDAMQSQTNEFTGVAPGHYELVQGDPPRIVDLDASVSQHLDPTLGTPTVSVHGSLRSASGQPLAGDGSVTLESLDAARPQNPIQTVCIRGAFSFPAVPPGDWELWVESSGRQLPIASTTVGNRARPGNLVAVRDRPLSVVVAVSEAATRVQGFARKDGKGVAGVMVVLAPKDTAAFQGLVRRDQSDSDGSFSLHDVVPGQYTLVAIEDAWELDWAQPEVIGRYLPGGIAVTVTDSSGKLLTLAVPVPVETRQ
jgi:hypothetical protein